MNRYNVHFSSKLNAGWADVEVSAGTSAGAIAQVHALYPDAWPYPPANYRDPPLNRQQMKAAAGRTLKKG